MRLGECHLLAFGLSPHTPFQSFLLITLPKTSCFKIEKGTRDSSLGPPGLLQAWLLASPSKQQNRGRRWPSTASQFPPHTLLGPQGQVPLSYPVFFHHHLSGVCSELTSLPKMKCMACWRPSRCSSPWDVGAIRVTCMLEQRQHAEGPS